MLSESQSHHVHIRIREGHVFTANELLRAEDILLRAGAESNVTCVDTYNRFGGSRFAVHVRRRDELVLRWPQVALGP